MRSIGIHEDWTATPPGRTPAQILQRYPRSGIGRCFTGKPLTTVQDLRPKVLATLKPYLDAGVKKIYISIKTDQVQTKSGAWGARYYELGKAILDIQAEHDVEIVVIPWHEPEDDFVSGRDFVKYYDAVHGPIANAGGPDIKIMPCYMTYHWAPGSGGSVRGKTNSPNEWFNASIMRDGVIADVYSGRTFKLENTLLEHPGFARWVQYVPAELEINLGERGWETPSSTFPANRSQLRVATMHREFLWLLSDHPVAKRIKDYTIWSSPGTENAVGLIMDHAAEAEIDWLLANAYPVVVPPPAPESLGPDETDPQYKFGLSAGHALGRDSAFAEIRDLAAERITKE